MPDRNYDRSAKCPCGCVLFEDFFDGEELNPRYSFTPDDWTFGSGMVTAAADGSPFVFHSGAAQFFHVYPAFSMPSVGDWARVNFGGEYVHYARTNSTTLEVTAGSTTFITSPGSWAAAEAGLVMLFPRSKYGDFFDRFTATPDSDLVGIGEVSPNGDPGVPLYGFFGSCLPAHPLGISQLAAWDLGTGFTSWSVTAKTGVGLTYLSLVRCEPRCIKLDHSCCTACWPGGVPAQATVQISGASGGSPCNRSNYNGAWVTDLQESATACIYSALIEPANYPTCPRRFLSASYVLVDEVADTFEVTAEAPFLANANWVSSSPVTRAEICGGSTISMVPQTGSAGGVTLTVAFS